MSSALDDGIGARTAPFRLPFSLPHSACCLLGVTCRGRGRTASDKRSWNATSQRNGMLPSSKRTAASRTKPSSSKSATPPSSKPPPPVAPPQAVAPPAPPSASASPPCSLSPSLSPQPDAPAFPSHNPVKAALVASLETQLAQTRMELSEQYKIQSSNAQRLFALTDNLRDAEERGREERDELRRLRHEVDGLRDRARWHKEVVAEKEKQLLVSRVPDEGRRGAARELTGTSQILQDDHASLELELSQVTIQNENLKIDNSGLVRRWLETKNEVRVAALPPRQSWKLTRDHIYRRLHG